MRKKFNLVLDERNGRQEAVNLLHISLSFSYYKYPFVLFKAF